MSEEKRWRKWEGISSSLLVSLSVIRSLAAVHAKKIGTALHWGKIREIRIKDLFWNIEQVQERAIIVQ